MPMLDFLLPAPAPPTELGRMRILSRTAGIRVSPLCLGAMSIGEAWKDGMGSMNKAQSFALLDGFVTAGGNFIDTANNYQSEQSELWLGEWMQERGNRDQIVLATKYTTCYRNWELPKGTAVANYSGNSRRSLHVSVRDSLSKLRTDWIDVLYLHWWDWTTSIPEIMDSLHILVTQGKVLYLGVSDTPAWLVSAANEYALAHAKTPFSVYQGHWSVMMRDMERDIVPMARHYGMALAPWGALGGGKFQSRKALELRKAQGEGMRNIMGDRGAGQSDTEVRVSEALASVAAENGIESVTAVALAWIMAKAPNVFPIVGGRKVEHLTDNIQALSLNLTEEQMEFLDGLVPLKTEFPKELIGEDPATSGGKLEPLMNSVAQFAWVKEQQAIGRV